MDCGRWCERTGCQVWVQRSCSNQPDKNSMSTPTFLPIAPATTYHLMNSHSGAWHWQLNGWVGKSTANWWVLGCFCWAVLKATEHQGSVILQHHQILCAGQLSGQSGDMQPLPVIIGEKCFMHLWPGLKAIEWQGVWSFALSWDGLGWIFWSRHVTSYELMGWGTDHSSLDCQDRYFLPVLQLLPPYLEVAVVAQSGCYKISKRNCSWHTCLKSSETKMIVWKSWRKWPESSLGEETT